MKAKIYTKTGDAGQTSLLGGTRVRKTDARLEAYGTLDELNSILGWLRTELSEGVETDSLRASVDVRLERIQNCLFDIGSHLACEKEELRGRLPGLREEDVDALERDMDRWETELPALQNFILPGGSRLAALTHLARTVCRRGERSVFAVTDAAPAQAVFLNRLSDWLFLLARKFNQAAGRPDVAWSK